MAPRPLHCASSSRQGQEIDRGPNQGNQSCLLEPVRLLPKTRTTAVRASVINRANFRRCINRPASLQHIHKRKIPAKPVLLWPLSDHRSVAWTRIHHLVRPPYIRNGRISPFTECPGRQFTGKERVFFRGFQAGRRICRTGNSNENRKQRLALRAIQSLFRKRRGHALGGRFQISPDGFGSRGKRRRRLTFCYKIFLAGFHETGSARRPGNALTRDRYSVGISRITSLF